MIVSHKLAFVFVGIPRTASRALHAGLKQLPGAYQPWGGLHRMTVPAAARGYFTFCCVRNPYARLYSHYCCCWGKRRRWWAGRVRVRSFREYLDVLAKGKLGGSCGAKYQTTVRGYLGPTRADAFLPYEQLPSALQTITQIAGIADIALPRRGCHLSGNWKEHYDESLAQQVYELAREDFEEFGYDQESWRARATA